MESEPVRPLVSCRYCGMAPSACEEQQEQARNNAPAGATAEQRSRRGWYRRCCANCSHIT